MTLRDSLDVVYHDVDFLSVTWRFCQWLVNGLLWVEVWICVEVVVDQPSEVDVRQVVVELEGELELDGQVVDGAPQRMRPPQPDPLAGFASLD